jgi:hypothetical protein
VSTGSSHLMSMPLQVLNWISFLLWTFSGKPNVRLPTQNTQELFVAVSSIPRQWQDRNSNHSSHYVIACGRQCVKNKYCSLKGEKSITENE